MSQRHTLWHGSYVHRRGQPTGDGGEFNAKSHNAFNHRASRLLLLSDAELLRDAGDRETVRWVSTGGCREELGILGGYLCSITILLGYFHYSPLLFYQTIISSIIHCYVTTVMLSYEYSITWLKSLFNKLIKSTSHTKWNVSAGDGQTTAIVIQLLFIFH